MRDQPHMLRRVAVMGLSMIGAAMLLSACGQGGTAAPIRSGGLPATVEPAAVATPPPQINAGTTWSQLGGNPQRWSYVDSSLPSVGSDVSLAWQVRWIWNGPAGVDSAAAADHMLLPKATTPIIGGGMVFIGHDDGVIRAISAQTGQQVWQQTVGGQILNSGAYDAATSSVFFASTSGHLLRLRASDGVVLGDFTVGSEVRQAPLLVSDTVYIGGQAGILYAVSISTMQARWSYTAGAALLSSAAYAAKGSGLVILSAEDKSVHAVRVSDGVRVWRVTVNGSEDPKRGNVRFPDTFPVVSEANDVVIIRSYFDWSLTWTDSAGAPADQADTRTFLTNNVDHQSFFVLDLDDGAARYVAPVLSGGIGNGGDYYSTPPQVVIRKLADNSEVAYLFWRTRVACRIANCDGREDTTLGEMDLQTGTIRFIDDHKSQGTMRFPTDEQGALSMAGDVLFHSHWMSLGAIRIPNRATGGSSYANPIPSSEYLSVSNTLDSNQCALRNSAAHYCPVGHTPPGEGQLLDAGFYIYASSTTRVYDQYFTPPVRSAVISDGVIYWKSVDGAIIALEPVGGVPSTPTPFRIFSPFQHR